MVVGKNLHIEAVIDRLHLPVKLTASAVTSEISLMMLNQNKPGR